MSIEQTRDDLRLATAIGELQTLVKQRFPTANFQVGEGEDPDGTYLRAIVDVEDTDEVMETVVSRLVTLQVEEHLPLYFIPLRPSERVEGELSARTRAGGLSERFLKVSDYFLPAS
jgi:hypothetical protein